MAYASYLLTLVLWVAFLPAAFRAPADLRLWPWAAVVVGVAAVAWEWGMTFGGRSGAGAAIRLDIPLLVVGLGSVYLLVAVRLWAAGMRGPGVVTGGLALLALGGFGAAWTRIGAESRALTRNQATADGMLFEAKFRNESAYRTYFGMDSEGGADLPVGHWEPAGPGASLTRLVVNPAGHAVLFYGCGETECQYGPGATLEARAVRDTEEEAKEANGGEGGEREGKEAKEGDGWRALIVNRGVGQRELTVARTGVDTLEVRVDSRAVTLTRTPPPLLGLPDGGALTALDAFSAVAPAGANARVSQLWLWRDGPDLLGVGVFAVLVAGRRADFVSPAVLGRGAREGDGYRFGWRAGRERWEAHATLTDSGVVWEMPDREERWPPQLLAPGAVFRDDVMELAPLDDADAWARWMEVQLVAHFVSGMVPGGRSGS